MQTLPARLAGSFLAAACSLSVASLAHAGGGGVVELSAAMSGDFYQQTVLTDGPVVYWRLGEASAASPAINLGTHGSAADGTYTSDGGLTFGTPGAIFGSSDTAITLPGNATNFVISPTTAVGSEFPTTEFSLEYWINAPSQGATATFSYAVPGSDNEVLNFVPDATALFVNATSNTSGLDVADGDWHHFVTTWRSSDGQWRTYVDGILAADLVHTNTTPLDSVDGIFVLGQESDSVGGTFSSSQALTGSLDEFALYDTVLTPEQVLQHYDVGVGNILPPPPLTPEPGTLALFGILLTSLAAYMHRRKTAQRA